MTTPLSHEDLTRRCTPSDPHELGVVGDRGVLSTLGGLGVAALGYGLGSRAGRRGGVALGALGYLIGRTLLRQRFAREVLEQRSRTTSLGKRPTLAVVLPAYNTGFEILATVEEIVDKLSSVLEDERGIVVVDDGSDPASMTIEYAREAGAFVVEQPRNMGKGAAVRAGFGATTSDVVAFLDADGAYDPDLLLTFMEEIRYYDVVIGVRATGAAGGRSLARDLASRFFHALSQVVLLAPRRDTQAGIKLVRREVADAFCAVGSVDRFAFDVELLALCETRGWRIGEVAVAPRDQPVSTVRFSGEALRTCLSVLGIRKRQATGAYHA